MASDQITTARCRLNGRSEFFARDHRADCAHDAWLSRRGQGRSPARFACRRPAVDPRDEQHRRLAATRGGHREGRHSRRQWRRSDREHRVATALAARGAAVVEPWPGCEPVVDPSTGFVVTLWCRLERVENSDVSELVVGRSLQELHRSLSECDLALPSFRVALDRARRALADDSRMAALDAQLPSHSSEPRTTISSSSSTPDDGQNGRCTASLTMATTSSSLMDCDGSTSRPCVVVRSSGTSPFSPNTRRQRFSTWTLISWPFCRHSTVRASQRGVGYKPASPKCAATANIT